MTFQLRCFELLLDSCNAQDGRGLLKTNLKHLCNISIDIWNLPYWGKVQLVVKIAQVMISNSFWGNQIGELQPLSDKMQTGCQQAYTGQIAL